MVRRVLLAPRLPVDFATLQAVRRLGREQQMIDPEPIIVIEGLAVVVPIAVDMAFAVQAGPGFRVAQIEQSPELPARFGTAQGVVLELDRIIGVVVARNDIVVAAQDYGLFTAQKFFRVGAQALHPAEFIGKLVA